MILYNHNTDPPERHVSKPGKTTIYIAAEERGFPLANLPGGWYEAGPDDSVPAGMRAVSWAREIRKVEDKWLSINVPTCEPMAADPTLPARTACISAIQDTLMSLFGCIPAVPDWTIAIAVIGAMDPTPTILAGALKLMALRTQLLELGGQWTDVFAETQALDTPIPQPPGVPADVPLTP